MNDSFPLFLDRHGLILVNKSIGFTSHDIVHQVRKIFQTKKVGHSGTLDPFSQGLLLLLIGEAVSLQQYFTTRSKVYRARFKLGITTDTLDPTGEITETDTQFIMPSRQVIEEQIASSFMGELRQTPPNYSAIKIKGQRAYALARKGKSISLPKRTIRVSQFDVLSILGHEMEVRIACSSGTYIRTLASDLAKKLGTVGMVESLIREQIGSYNLKDALDIERNFEQYQKGILKNTHSSQQIPSFEELYRKFPGIIPMNVLIDRENFLKGIRINCSRDEFFMAKNGNFSFSLLNKKNDHKYKNGIFHLIHKNTVLMILERKSGETRILFNLLKYIEL